MSYLEQAKRAAARLQDALPAPSAIPDGDATLRPKNPGFHATVAHLVAMDLAQFESQGQPLELRVPWHSETLWFVPTEADVERLQREGVSRGRIWTAGELANVALIQAPGSVRLVALTKLGFSGDVVAVIPQSPGGTASKAHDG